MIPGSDTVATLLLVGAAIAVLVVSTTRRRPRPLTALRRRQLDAIARRDEVQL